MKTSICDLGLAEPRAAYLDIAPNGKNDQSSYPRSIVRMMAVTQGAHASESGH